MERSRSQSSLLATAKEQLGYLPTVPDTVVPGVYLAELEKHLQLYPHDSNFLLTRQPGQGFGYVTCLEEGCLRAKIELIMRVGSPDGGKTTGIGSLAAYRTHIIQSSVHCASRDARIRSGCPNPLSIAVPARTPNRTSRILTSLDSEDGWSSPTRIASSPAAPLGQHLSGLSMRGDSSVPQKRASDHHLAKTESFEPQFSLHGGSSYKRQKLEFPKAPLALANRRTPEPFGDQPAAPSSGDVEDTRARLADITSRISQVTSAMQRARWKSALTKADYTRISKLEKELNDLRGLRNKYTAAIPSAITSSPTRVSSIIKAEPAESSSSLQPRFFQFRVDPNFGDVKPLPPVISQPIASGSNVKIETVKPPAIFSNPAAADPHFSDDERFDENGNFFGRGKDLYEGPIAKADDIDKFLVAAGNSEQFDGNASVEKALERLNLQNLYHPLPGMEVALMPHQAIGVAWMLDKENSTMKGGALADEMGLGKTVQMIAVIATNRSNDPLRKATLIIAPVALLDQWQQEIDMKTNLNLSCLIYHGSNKPKRSEDINKYDIVLTTFHTLAYEWPDFEAEEKEKAKRKRKNKNDDDDDYVKPKKRGAKKELGLLFTIEWHRICIDEAQNIRNKRTRISRAVSELEAKYRWCLTGTPIINTLSDAYGLFRFLKIRPWYDWNHFNAKIARNEKKQPDLASSRLQSIFQMTLLRRKKDTMLDGKRLIELPARNVVLRKLQFSQEERDIYAMVEAKSQAKFNRFLRAGTVLKNYHQVLVLLLRLRQICSHPTLIQEDGDGFVRPEEAEDGGDTSAELARAARLVSMEFVNRMKSKFKEIVLERMAAEKESTDASLEGEECPICYDTFTDAVVTCCTHVFCRECIMNVLHTPAREDANEINPYKANERPCPSCRGAISEEKLFTRQAFEPTDDELSPATNAKVEDVEMIDLTDDVKGKGKAPAGRTLRKRRAKPIRILDSDEEMEDDEDDDLSDFIVEDDEDEEEADARIAARRVHRSLKGKQRAIVISDDEDEDIIFGAKPSVPIPPEKVKMMPRFLPSTKMKHMMDSLMSWAKEHPDEKTLVISQWTQCLSLVSNYLAEHGFAHVKYQGDMTRHQRDASVRTFMSKDKAKIMLMSLKCGGVGLNLTRANRVISLDLGWSEAIENQAFDRVHRLGQMRDVTVERLVIQDTVEDRILALQERKRNLAEGSLGEGNGKKIGRLSVKELASLFNVDTRGNLLH
ncbi:unnamed protein product [Somion occarium]